MLKSARAGKMCVLALQSRRTDVHLGIAESLTWDISVLNDAQCCAVSVAGSRAQLLGTIGFLLPTHMEMP